MSFSRYTQTPPYHCRCCRFANERIIVPYAAYSRRTGIKRLFFEDDHDNNTTLIRLPSISDICKPYAGLSLGAGDIQFDAGCVPGPGAMEQQWQWQGNPATVEAFLYESRRRPSMSAIGFWEQMRPGVVCRAFGSLSIFTLIH